MSSNSNLLFFQFDEALSPSTLLSIISQLEKVGAKVVALVSDMGPKNLRLWRELGININKPSSAFITNPADQSR